MYALREEGDLRGDGTWATPPDTFLSTPSARRATQLYRARFLAVRISIHALREEGDSRLP